MKVLEAVNQDIICACVQKQALDLKKVCIFAMHIHCVGTGPLVVYRHRGIEGCPILFYLLEHIFLFDIEIYLTGVFSSRLSHFLKNSSLGFGNSNITASPPCFVSAPYTSCGKHGQRKDSFYHSCDTFSWFYDTAVAIYIILM